MNINSLILSFKKSVLGADKTQDNTMVNNQVKGTPFIDILIGDVAKQILEQLSLRDLLNFEAVCKSHSIITCSAWEKLQNNHPLKAEWADCQNDTKKIKWNYVLSASFMKFLEKTNGSNRSQVLFNCYKLKEQYDGLNTRFASFGGFIKNKIKKIEHNSDDDKKMLKVIDQNAKNGFSGDLILQGLLGATSVRTNEPSNMQASFKNFSDAIERNTTFASFIAVKFTSMQENDKLELAKMAADKKDDTALSFIFEGKSLSELIKFIDSPYNFPILYEKIGVQYFKIKNLKMAEMYFDKALEEYKEKASVYFLINMALTKFNLKKWEEAELLYTKATEANGNRVSINVFTNIALTKFNLEKWEEAEELFTKAIKAYGNQVPPDILAKAALTKFNLEKWEEAEELFTKAIKAYENQVLPHGLLSCAAKTKFELEKWEEAEELYTEAIWYSGTQKPPDVLVEAATTKCKLKKWKEAESLYTKAIEAYGNQVPPDVLEDTAITKLNLKKWEEAEQFFTKAIEAYGNQVPPNVLANAAIAKFNLKKWEEAEQFFTKAIEAYGNQVPPDVLAIAALTKFNLEKWEEAEELFAKAIEAYGNQVPPDVLESITKTKFKLKKWEEAEQLFTKAIDAYRNLVPRFLVMQKK